MIGGKMMKLRAVCDLLAFSVPVALALFWLWSWVRFAAAIGISL